LIHPAVRHGDKCTRARSNGIIDIFRIIALAQADNFISKAATGGSCIATCSSYNLTKHKLLGNGELVIGYLLAVIGYLLIFIA
jgi:hypothetical protein